MTSRLTVTALVFSVLSTVTLVCMADARPASTEATVARVVQLDRVTITVPRLVTKA